MDRGQELHHAGWTARFDEDGTLLGLHHPRTTVVTAVAARPIVVEVGGRHHELRSPAGVTQDHERLQFVYEVAAGAGLTLTVTTAFRLLPLPCPTAPAEASPPPVALETAITLAASDEVRADVAVRLPAALSVDPDPERFAPLRDGVGHVRASGKVVHDFYDVLYDSYSDFTWHLAGETRTYLGSATRALGLPLVSEASPATGWRVTWCTDPYFTTGFRLRGGRQRELNWRYPGAVGLREPETRHVYACVHHGPAEGAIDAFYATALADVPPGPAWLHDIALVHYDYLADGGDSWFRDIDALAGSIDPAERGRVCLCLHGWYDLLGRFCMDEDTRAIEDRWTALIHRGENLATGSAEHVPMSRARVREMLRYARDHGFRVTLMFGDGPVAAGDWAHEVFGDDAVLKCGGWEAVPGHAVVLNPLHPEVRRWFTDYVRAVLAAFGDDLDGLVWDETYYIAAGELGPKACPGYADRAWMTLIREVAGIVHDHRADLALLGGDCIGTSHALDSASSVGYSLVADGCWQDSACEPGAWAYGLFPNFRNVLWSCNWRPLQRFDMSEYGVRQFGAPVPTSNGFLEDRGPSQIEPGELARVIALFEERAATPRPRFWLTDDDPRVPRRVRSLRSG